MEMTEEEMRAAHEAACERLRPLGFEPTDAMRFVKDGVIYDLSAADLDQIERIERDQHCVVGYLTRAAQAMSLERIARAEREWDESQEGTGR